MFHWNYLQSTDSGLANDGNAKANASTAGVEKTLSLLARSAPEWIIDTGTTNHMISNLYVLDKITIKKIKIPNGNISNVTHSGNSSISSRSTI